MEDSQYLTFHLSDGEYAIGILQVKEIIPYGTVTKVPQMPGFVRGVFNLRGSVVPVLDLALIFSLGTSLITERTCIVVVEVNLDGEPTVIGIVADSVSQVIDLPASEILAAPVFGTRVSIDFLRGMAKKGGKFILILDINKAVSTKLLDWPHSRKSSECARGSGDDPKEII
jgi:purine-binding chemotaxis protein CheW